MLLTGYLAASGLTAQQPRHFFALLTYMLLPCPGILVLMQACIGNVPHVL